MSSESIRNNIASTQRTIQSLQRRLADKSKEEATKTNRINSINRSITKQTSISSLQSKQRQVQTIENELARIQNDKAGLSRRVADETARLHTQQQSLYKEQDREQKKFQQHLEQRDREQRRKQQELVDHLRVSSSTSEVGTISEDEQQMEYDAFISHASEDKADLVRPLAEALVSSGLKIWYDEFELTVGDSLRRSIDKGLARSRFGIVVLSPSFFAKDWPQYELDGLVAKEMSGGKLILPLWHKVSKNEVIKYSPTLADRVALSTAMYTIEELVTELTKPMKDA